MRIGSQCHHEVDACILARVFLQETANKAATETLLKSAYQHALNQLNHHVRERGVQNAELAAVSVLGEDKVENATIAQSLQHTSCVVMSSVPSAPRQPRVFALRVSDDKCAVYCATTGTYYLCSKNDLNSILSTYCKTYTVWSYDESKWKLARNEK